MSCVADGRLALQALVGYGPDAAAGIKAAPGYFSTHEHLASHGLHLQGACFPHHAGSFAWVPERIDEGFDHGAPVFRLRGGEQGVPDCCSQREALDPLSRPVRGDLLTAHAPYLFRIGFEKDIEKPLPKPIAYPILK